MSEFLYVVYAGLMGGLLYAAGVVCFFLTRMEKVHKLEDKIKR